MKKQIISSALALSMVFGGAAYLPEGVDLNSEITAQAGTYGDFEYTLSEDENSIVIDRYRGNASNVTIPSQIDGKKVTGILSGAFFENKTLKSVTIPKGVTSISGAFSECKALTSVTLPEGITDISHAFSYCTALKKIVLPESVTDISGAFFDCPSLESVNIPKSVNNLEWAFYNCKKLKNFTIPDGVKSIAGTFYGTGITSIVIPDSVENITKAFNDCTSLKSVKLPKNLKEIGDEAFAWCRELTELDIPKTVTRIGDYALAGCGVTKGNFTVPETVTELGNTVFTADLYYDERVEFGALKSVTILGSKTKIDKNTFDMFLQLTVYCPKDSEVYKYAMKNVYYTYTGKAENGLESFNFGDVWLEFNSNCTAELSGNSFTYTGSAIKPAVTVRHPGMNNKTLTEGVDYTVTYSDNVNKGTAKVLLKGIGVYSGSGEGMELEFKITAASIKNASVSDIGNKVYTGKAIKPSPTVKIGSKTLKKGTDYTLSYKNNVKCGKATVTVTGKGNYTGKVTKTFIIKPKKAAVKKLSSPKTRQLKVTIKKSAGGVTGYQITYSTSKKFTKKTTKSVRITSTSRTIKNLKKGKTYYVKVRAYKKTGGVRYFSSYSAVKKLRIK
ncbi:MAG: fibronectin type III domain-containing protein [Ruminococcus sp.]|nr:fibronectin type III domain-containing protein [Ruminococcus sp.]